MATVLVVDDRAENRGALATLLGFHGHRVLEVDDGHQALEIARSERPAVIITDVAMPLMDGFELASRLRRDPATAGIPVVFHTAVFHEEPGRNLARDCGVEHVLTKPSDPATILSVVHDVVERCKAGTSLPAAPGFAEQHVRLIGDTLVQKLAELEASNVRLSALLTFSQELAYERSPAEMLDFAAASTRRLTGAPSAAVYLRDRGADADHLAAASNDTSLTAPFDWPATTAGGGWAGRLHEIRSVPVPEVDGASGLLCIAGASGDPLQADQQPLIAGIAGLLAIAYQSARQHDTIRRHAAELEQQVAQRTAELRTLNRRLEQEAISDPLTGLFNRRYMTELLEREFSRARRAGTPVAFILADIDHFKRINDTFGHAAGDAALCAVAVHLGGRIRHEDALCRYGGEEFLIVLGGFDAAGALRRAEALRRSLAEQPIEHAGRTLRPVTLSIGVAIFPDHGETPAAVLAAADQALYQAKSAGRNRSVLAAGVA